ncbi:trypsin-like serine protease [Micromonospora sp. WMMD1155]|nr:trypsin-like serine protease [Micromonospora sp. WMMD1155]
MDDSLYPGADEILAEQNVRLIAGDGHIILADCASPPTGDIGLLKIYTTDETIGADGIGRACFKVTATGGWLTLAVPGVYEIRGDGQRPNTGHEMTADLVADDGEEISVEVDPDGSTQVGLGADPEASPTMLVQLRAGDGMAPVSGAQAAVGKITTLDRQCTATLVSPRWLLTAASCFADNPVAPVVNEAKAPEGSRAVLPGKGVVAVDWVSPQPGRDVALARLVTAVDGVTPLTVATVPAIPGVSVPAVGFGQTATDRLTDTQRIANVTFSATTATTLSAPTGPQICQGMAGAPVLVGGKVAAVLSQAGQEGCLDVTGAGSAVTGARVDDLPTWVSAITTTYPGAAHTWTLTDMPADATNGTQVLTVGDSVHNGTPMPLTATAGATWTTGDSTTPAVALDGVSGSLASTQPAVSKLASFTLSMRVKLDAFGGTVISQDSGYANHPAYRLWPEASDRSWRFSVLDGILTRNGPPTWSTVSTAPETSRLGTWTHIAVHYERATRRLLLKIDGVPAASATYSAEPSPKNPYPPDANGSFRVGAVKNNGVVGGFLDGTISAVQTSTNAVMPAGPAIDCDPQVTLYGVNADNRLTYTLIEPYTRTVVRRLTSNAPLGFAPLAIATLNDNTVLMTSPAGPLYRVDITNNTTGLTFGAPVAIGSRWTGFTQLTYHGSYLHGVTAAGSLQRYTIYPDKPVSGDITGSMTIGTGFTLNTLAASANQHIIGTKTTDGTLHNYLINGVNSFYDWPLGHTWSNLSHLLSPGSGLYYARDKDTGKVTVYFDKNPENDSGSDITELGPLVDPVGWTQTKLSAAPGCGRPMQLPE